MRGVERVERRAVRAHESGYVRADDVASDFLLERAEYRVVQECAALDYNMFAERIGVGGADYLVQRVFDYRYRQSGGDVVDSRAVLLRLLYGRVHKDRAARAEVDRRGREQPLAREVGDVLTERAGKGLQERAAARRAGFV